MQSIKFISLLGIFGLLSLQAQAQLKDLNEDALFFYVQLEDFKTWLQEQENGDVFLVDTLKIDARFLQLEMIIIEDSSLWNEREVIFKEEFGKTYTDSLEAYFRQLVNLQKDSSQVQYTYLDSSNKRVETLLEQYEKRPSKSVGSLAPQKKESGKNAKPNPLAEDQGEEEVEAPMSAPIVPPGVSKDKVRLNEKYYILAIQGKISRKKTGRPIKRGSYLQANEQIQFQSSNAKAVVLSSQRGRFIIEARKNAQRSELVSFVFDVLIPLKQVKELSVR